MPEADIAPGPARPAGDLQVQSVSDADLPGRGERLGARLREQGEDRFLVAEVAVDNADGKIQTGMLGAGKISAGRRSIVTCCCASRRATSGTRSGRCSRERRPRPRRLPPRAPATGRRPRRPPRAPATGPPCATTSSSGTWCSMGEVTRVVKKPRRPSTTTSATRSGPSSSSSTARGRRRRSSRSTTAASRRGRRVALILEWEEKFRKSTCRAVGRGTNSTLLAEVSRRPASARRRRRRKGSTPSSFCSTSSTRTDSSTARCGYVRWIWTPPVVAVWAVAAVWTIGVFVLNWATDLERDDGALRFLRKPLLDIIQFFFILSFIGAIHELAHAYAVKIYGGEVHDIGVALLYFTPAFYCDTTDAMLFPSKWHRLWVTGAGIYIEGFICSLATPSGWCPIRTPCSTSSRSRRCSSPACRRSSSTSTRSSRSTATTRWRASSRSRSCARSRSGTSARSSRITCSGSRSRSRSCRAASAASTGSTACWRSRTRSVIMRFIGGLFYNLYRSIFPNVAIVLLLLLTLSAALPQARAPS